MNRANGAMGNGQRATSHLARAVIVALLIAHCPLRCLPSQSSPVANEDAFLLDTLWSRYRALLPKDDIKVGVALGGGGARGLAHIGVLKALEEEDVPVGAIAGTSVGALIGSLYAAGVTTAQMEQMTQEIGWSSLTNYSRFSLLRLMMTGQKLVHEQYGGLPPQAYRGHPVR